MEKIVFILSTGRTGTKKLANYFNKFCSINVRADHQTPETRIINILSNMNYYGFSVKKMINRKVHQILRKNNDKKFYINCDPLLSFGLSCVDFKGLDVCFIHIERNPDDFSRSMVNWQFSKTKSLLAHNFVPFWQPNLWPFEHILHLFNKEYLKKKYREIWQIKNEFFEREFKNKYPYLKVKFEDLYDIEKGKQVFQQAIDFMGIKIEFNPDVFFKRENVSMASFFK